MKHLIRKTLPRLLAACAAIATLLAFPAVCPAQDFEPLQPPDIVLGSRVTDSGAIRRADDIAIDEVRRKVYVADASLHRVLRFSMDEAGKIGGQAEAVFGQEGNFVPSTSVPAISATSLSRCSGVCVDAEGRLWVVDTGNNRVLRFDKPWQTVRNVSADGVLGQPSFTTDTSTKGAFGKLWQPRGVAAGPNGELYVADTGNHRVVRYDNAASKATGLSFDGVIGQIDTTSTDPFTQRHRMTSPTGLCLTHFNYMGAMTVWLWVADTGNNRVLMFINPHSKNKNVPADKVLGQSAYAESTPAAGSRGMNRPQRLAGGFGQLWVADSGNNRVLRFDLPTAKPDLNGAADSVLGQSDMNSTSPGTQLRYMDDPSGLAINAEGDLWVGDVDNRRVLYFKNAPQMPAGAFATLPLGANLPAIFDAIMTPNGLAIDRLTGKLFVADTAGNRVLRYKNYAALTTGTQPEGVLGQPDFVSTQPRGGDDGLNAPMGLYIDNNRRLWVADTGNHRVLRFNNADIAPKGQKADKVLGQSFFNTVDAPEAPNAARLRSPRAVWYHNENLFVADTGHHRVLVFQQVNSMSNGGVASRVWGQVNMTEARNSETSAGHLNGPYSLCVTPNGDLWVADTGHHRVLGFLNPLGAYRREADKVLGQLSFTTKTLSGLTVRQMVKAPSAVTVDGSGRLWVASSGGTKPERVTCYEDERNLPTIGGQPAFPLGQSAWNSSGIYYSLVDITPTAIVPDPVGGGLWVASGPRSRVSHYAPLVGPGAAGGDLRITESGINAQGRFYLKFEAPMGKNCVVFASENLQDWSHVSNVLTINAALTTWTDTRPATGQQFYRVIVQ